MVIHLAQAVEVAVEDEHLRVHADGDGGRGEAGDAGADDDDPGAAHAGHARDERAVAPARPHQVMGHHERRHAPGHLAHGRQQRQRVVLVAHGLVGDGDIAGVDERVGALA